MSCLSLPSPGQAVAQASDSLRMALYVCPLTLLPNKVVDIPRTVTPAVFLSQN